MSSGARFAKGGYCMREVEHARSLLRLAQHDLNAVIAMQESALVADEIVGFHAQQSVEKALKAWMSATGLVYPLTHQLPRPLALLESAGADVESFLPLVRFTQFDRVDWSALLQRSPLLRAGCDPVTSRRNR
jgi:hypothetical protein